MNELGPLIWLLILAVAFYFLILRPARVRQRQTLQVQSALRPGLEVMTTAGLYATVIAIEDDAVLLEVAPGVVSRYAKGAVARVVTPADGADGMPEESKPEKPDEGGAAG